MTRLADLLRAAAQGRFPPADAGVEVLPSPPGPSDAVVAFTAHHVVAADVPATEVFARLDPQDIGAPMTARFLSWLADRLGFEAGVLDSVLAAGAIAGPSPVPLIPRDDLVQHPRAARSIRYRTDVRVYADPDEHGLITMGRGLAGRLEVSIEVDADHRDRGLGRALAAAARSLAPAGEPVFAQVSPGNVASLRAFLAAGYRPIGAEVLFLRADERGVVPSSG